MHIRLIASFGGKDLCGHLFLLHPNFFIELFKESQPINTMDMYIISNRNRILNEKRNAEKLKKVFELHATLKFEFYIFCQIDKKQKVTKKLVSILTRKNKEFALSFF